MTNFLLSSILYYDGTRRISYHSLILRRVWDEATKEHNIVNKLRCAADTALQLLPTIEYDETIIKFTAKVIRNLSQYAFFSQPPFLISFYQICNIFQQLLRKLQANGTVKKGSTEHQKIRNICETFLNCRRSLTDCSINYFAQIRSSLHVVLQCLEEVPTGAELEVDYFTLKLEYAQAQNFLRPHCTDSILTMEEAQKHFYDSVTGTEPCLAYQSAFTGSNPAPGSFDRCL